MSAPVLDAALPLLCCPHCRAALRRVDRDGVGCENGHRFDIARQGYLSLLGKRSRTDTGDSADMVAARVAFLGGEHYRQVADAVASVVGRGPVLEIGAGTGYYLSAVVDRLGVTGDAPVGAAPVGEAPVGEAPVGVAPVGVASVGVAPVGVALDSSRYAARRAATAHPSVASVVADAWSPLPVGDGAMGTVLSVFAPRDPAEIARVLTPGGHLVVVTPEPDHLSEVRSVLRLLAVDAGKPDRLVEAFAAHLPFVDRRVVRREMRLAPADVGALVRMGPSARHLSSHELAAAVAALPDVTAVTLAVTVSVFRRRPDAPVAARPE